MILQIPYPNTLSTAIAFIVNELDKLFNLKDHVLFNCGTTIAHPTAISPTSLTDSNLSV